ncbi:MAG TPA: monovalent cation/H(+) antiporter subunit G [Euzebyales bacterium]
MLAILIDIVVGILLLAGCLLALIAAVGLHRFPDLFCRMHAATKPATLGMLCIAVAVGIAVPVQGSVVKLLLVVVLQFLTAPVAAHMVGRAAYKSGIEMASSTILDELGRSDRANRYGAAG